MNTNNAITVTAIDLGSSAVKIAAVLKGGVEIITNQANFRQTPNVVAFGQGQRNIGQAGQLKIKSNHANTVIAPSRYLGFSYSCPYIKQQLVLCPAKPKRAQVSDQNIKFNLMYGNNREQLSMQQLCSSMLSQTQKIISQTNNLSNRNLAISIPSYLSQSQRKCLLYSTKIMYSPCSYPIQLIEQQVCVSMDYGYGRRLDFAQQLQSSKNVLFVDFGHSKTTVFVTGFNKKSFRMLGLGFDRALGCKNIDVELIKFYANIFDQNNPHVQLKLMQSKKALLKLLDSVQKQRKVLSGTNQHDLSIECLLQQQDLSYTMKRQQFQQIAKPTINKFRKLLIDFANQLKQKGIKFDQIQLIGGGTRIPIIIKTISQVFNFEPSRTVNSNESVARGAALISAMNSSIFKVQSYNYFKINPYQVNLKINNEVIMPIFTKNEILLRQKILQVDVKLQQQKFIIQAEYTNELQQGLQKKIIRCPIEIISKFKSQINQQNQQNESLKLKLLFNLDCNGIIYLTSITSLNNNFNIKVGQINTFQKYTQTQLLNMQHKQKQMALRDLSIKKFYQEKNQFQSFIYKSNQMVDELVQNNQSFLNESHITQIKKLLIQEQNWLNSLSAIDQHQLVEQFKIKSTKINQNIQNLIKQIKVTKKHIEQRSRESSHRNQPYQSHQAHRHQPSFPQRMAQSQYRPRTRQSQKSSPFGSNLFGNSFNRFF